MEKIPLPINPTPLPNFSVLESIQWIQIFPSLLWKNHLLHNQFSRETAVYETENQGGGGVHICYLDAPQQILG